VATARQIGSEARPSFITNYIEVEAQALLVRKLARTIASDWLRAAGCRTSALPAEDESGRASWLGHIEKPWTSCDAISFAVLEYVRLLPSGFCSALRQQLFCLSAAVNTGYRVP
jgi:hypothetical protein